MHVGHGWGELLQLLAARDRLDARIAEEAAEFDSAGGWDLDAASSLQAWLRDRARMPPGPRRVADVGGSPYLRAAGAVPRVDGRIAVERADRGRAGQRRSSHRPVRRPRSSIVPMLVRLSLHETITVLQEWRRHADGLADARSARVAARGPGPKTLVVPSGETHNEP